ncbi:hypothetical protein [Roseibium sp. SCP14]|uniref:hypothetical protein n=1 Tax=Roseibium sp. SCP14 TaxID=3141375 RepID=UPI003335F958
MQVTPVSAIHALRIRQKPTVAPASDEKQTSTANGRFGDMAMIPAHLASAALQRETSHGAHAAYAIQLLASHPDHPETRMERHLHVQQYQAAAQEQEEDSYTVSLTA